MELKTPLYDVHVKAGGKIRLPDTFFRFSMRQA